MAKIGPNDTIVSIVVKLSEGNPGAAVALAALMKAAPSVDPDSAFGELTPLIDFDAYEIYGDKIHIMWKYVCKSDPVKVLSLFRAVQLGLRSQDIIHQALTGGEIDFASLLTDVQAELPRFGAEQLSL